MNEVAAILIHDGYENMVRSIMTAYDVLDREEECFKGNNCLGYSKSVLWEKLKEVLFKQVFRQKANYSQEEWLKLKRAHDKLGEEQLADGKLKLGSADLLEGYQYIP